MKTDLAPVFAKQPKALEAEKILKACVHCGFCTATCPTYVELRDERDSPRGRIYLIKQMLEGGKVTEKTRTHLDRCLTCRSCETTCPSGVQYGHLIDIARSMMEKDMPRGLLSKFTRWGLRKFLPNPYLFGTALRLGQTVGSILPAIIKNKIPARQVPGEWPAPDKKRKMLVLEGCAQKSATPHTNEAAANVLNKLNIALVTAPKADCCGAVSTHLGAHDEGRTYMRRNIDAWWPFIEQGAEAIIVSASGCGTMVKEYGYFLKEDPRYADKAARVSLLAKDLSEVLLGEDLTSLDPEPGHEKIALHIPCTLQHGLGLPDSVPQIFEKAGFKLANTDEKHICCGSAGTYSLLQPKLSKRLLKRKLKALEIDQPDIIATANVGCQLHLATGTKTPVRHWVELLDKATQSSS